MRTSQPQLNPQPEPPSPQEFILIASNPKVPDTYELVTGAGVIEINLRTRSVTLKYPEMPILERATKALGTALNTWRDTKDVHGLEELHSEVARLLVSSTKTVVDQAVF
jgi:hypothetical protein